MTLSSNTCDEITRQLAIQTAPAQVLSAIRCNDPNAEAAMITQRDLYNLATLQRNKKLGPLTLIQALVQELNADNNEWISEHQTALRNQITHQFFTRRSSQEALQRNHEVLIMDCIYKTNHFKMLLLVIGGQTVLHFTFYVAFVFLAKEKMDDYTWVMGQLETLYTSFNLSNLLVTVTDMERRLMNAIFNIFPCPGTNHFLSIWHICNNVAVNCKKKFRTIGEWEKFFVAWQKMMYALLELEYQTAWDRMNDEYNLTHPDCMEYSWETYIHHHCRQFVRCYTNQVLYFGTTVKSHGKSAHAILKKQLGISMDNLKKIVDGIKLLLTNQTHEHRIAMAQT